MERKNLNTNQTNTNFKHEPDWVTYINAVQSTLGPIPNLILAGRAQQILNVNIEIEAEKLEVEAEKFVNVNKTQRSEEKIPNENTGCGFEDYSNSFQNFIGPFPNINRSEPDKTLPQSTVEDIPGVPKAQPGDVNGSELTRHIEEVVKAIEEDLENMKRRRG